ncbi:MAG: autotransporter-associated beta strand repeat-containing protein, partial [Planctomycetales bacterium]|nr:autotransporter-associated beta strand repeat-containing protein [Planctomycetales bacterium]
LSAPNTLSSGALTVNTANSTLRPEGMNLTGANSIPNTINLGLPTNGIFTLGGRKDVDGAFALELSGSFVLPTPVAVTNQFLSVIDPATEVEISGIVSGGNNNLILGKTGVGTLVLSGNNTFDVRDTVLVGASPVNLGQPEGIRIDGGILRVAHNNALGAGGTSNVNVRGDLGAALELDGSGGNLSIANRHLILFSPDNGVGRGAFNRSSSASVVTGTMRSLAGDNTVTAQIDLRNFGNNGNTVTQIIGVDTGSLDLAGQVIGSRNDGNTTTTSNRNLLTVGGGTLRLSGSQNNTINGTFVVLDGTLELNKSGAIALAGGTLYVGDNEGNDNSDRVVFLQGVDQIQVGTLNIASTGLVDLNNQTEATGAVVNLTVGQSHSADIETGSGTLLLVNNVNVTPLPGLSNSVPATITGNLVLTTAAGAAVNRTYTINDGPGDIDLRIAATVGDFSSGPANFVKAGLGTLALAGDNDYSGSTTVSAGNLRLQHVDALGDTGSTTTTSVSNGAVLELDISGGGTIDFETLTVAGTGRLNGP